MKKKGLTIFLFLTLMLNFKVNAEEHNTFTVKSTSPHEITLLNHGLASFEERLQMIERAKESIDVEYFIYRTDKSAKILTQALANKARQGVKIRMLLDWFIVKRDFSPFYAHELEKSGVEIKYFNTVSSLQVMSAQYRNHRKVIIIDGKEVITGGRNIGDEYFDLHEKYSFLDRDIVVTGELVSTIAKTFDAMFNSQLSVHVDRDYLPYPSDPKYRRGDQENYRGYDIDIKNWNKNVADAKSFLETPVDSKLLTEIRKKGQIELNGVYKGICNEITFRTEQPELGEINRKSNRILKFDVFNRIRFAKESIVMESPYFIINDELGRYLSDALLRNIKVKALTNSLNSSDAPYVYAAFDTIIPKWLKRGLDAYIFIGSKPASYSVLEDQSGAARFGVHAKTMIFDHSDVMIGTYNVDPRSANYNSEMSITCDNNVELADVVQKDIDSRIESSIRLDTRQKIKEAEFQQISFGKRIIYYLSKGISYGFGFLL